MYLLKLALRPWRVAPFSQLFSSIAVAILLLLMSFLFWMQDGIQFILAGLGKEQRVTLYLHSSLFKSSTPESTATLTVEQNEKQILDQVWNEVQIILGPNSGVEMSQVGMQAFLQSLKGSSPEMVRELESLGPEITTIVPRYISLSGPLSAAVLERLQAIQGIESVEMPKDQYRPVMGVFSSLRWILRALTVGLSIALVTGLMHLARMNGYLHQDAIQLLKHWGADPSLLLVPGVFSGIFVGILGGLLACGGWMTLGLKMAIHVRSLSSFLQGMPLTGLAFGEGLLVWGVVLGIVSGILGSHFTRSQMIRVGGRRA